MLNLLLPIILYLRYQTTDEVVGGFYFFISVIEQKYFRCRCFVLSSIVQIHQFYGIINVLVAIKQSKSKMDFQ